MQAQVLVLNAGSSSLKFALFRTDSGEGLERLASGKIDGVGRAGAELKARRPGKPEIRRSLPAASYANCLDVALDSIGGPQNAAALDAVAHRIVHGGPRHFEPERVTPELLDDLRRLEPFDPGHLPAEIELIEAAQTRWNDLPQVVCFDTAFHRDLPRVARLLPIPRRYEAAGVRRYGFHGLSYEFLLGELRRLGDPAATRGRVVLAHLGNGASMAAVRDGRSVDTTMAFTPAAGLVMSTRSGDLDPGLLGHLAKVEGMTASQLSDLVARRSGLLGISETSADMRELLAREADDVKAAEAVEIFCYQARKWVGAYAAALGGLDALVFAGGIGENCPSIRRRICAELGFLGLALEEKRNTGNAALISSEASRIRVRVIHTDEEQVIARAAAELLARAAAKPGERA